MRQRRCRVDPEISDPQPALGIATSIQGRHASGDIVAAREGAGSPLLMRGEEIARRQVRAIMLPQKHAVVQIETRFLVARVDLDGLPEQLGRLLKAYLAAQRKAETVAVGRRSWL